MLDKIIWPVVAGVLSTLISNWITSAWQGLSTRDRWLISAAIGVAIAITVLIALSRRSGAKPPEDKTGKPKEAFNENEVKGNFRAEEVAVKGVDRSFSGNKTGGDFVVKDIKVGDSDE
ncbi:MAG TPA: hypothetical protein VF779_14510 [Pyrinomonadaceae bacterium]